jgi:hypothetical protein
MQTRKFQRAGSRTAAILGFAAAVTLAASASWAQQRIDTSGRALDANNRLGSGGYNAQRDSTPAINAGNAVVTGNVTGGAEFRGNVPYTDPRAFRGNLAGSGIDRFVRSSAGPLAPQGLSNAQTRRLYYGDSRGVAPPPGFQQLGSVGGYVPAPAPTRIGSDLRLGSIYDTPQVALPRPGQLILGGPLDASNNNQLITASPLYGVRALNTGEPGDADFVRRYTTAYRNNPFTTADDEAVQRLRDELRDSGDEEGTSDGDRTGGVSPLGNAIGNDPLNNRLENQPLRNDPLSTDVSSGQQVRQQLAVSPAVRQSAQYRAMVERLERFNEAQGVDPNVAAAREYNAQRRAVTALEEQNKPQQPQQPPGRQPGATGDQPLPGTALDPNLPGNQPPGNLTLPGDPNAAPPPGQGQLTGPSSLRERPKPPMISSLAEGVKAKGLEQLLKEAEQLMKEQKFVAAIDKYGTAQQVAQNNPLPLLGMANAELGASFYARAETHLRQAFSDPALLMAQYDLRNFIGEERLAFIVKDLKEIANNEKTSPRPLLLLAYIAYNEGNDRMAAGYLDLAEKRAGGDDGGFYASLRKHWQLPAVPGDPAELNK